jgi:hypothetical protein
MSRHITEQSTRPNDRRDQLRRETVVGSLGNTASKKLRPRRQEALTVTEAADTTALVAGAASIASAAAVVAWWRLRRSR